jgi:hypothetical protein
VEDAAPLRHFAFSDDLAVAGVLTRDTRYWEVAKQLTAGHPPAEAIELIFETIPGHARERGFRASPFMYAAAECSDALQAVRGLMAPIGGIRTLFSDKRLTGGGHLGPGADWFHGTCHPCSTCTGARGSPPADGGPAQTAPRGHLIERPVVLSRRQ